MPSTPSIRISQHQRYYSSHSPPALPALSATTSPMAIPRSREYVPPALPPPKYIPEISAGQDPGWQWGNDPNCADFGRAVSVKPGSSLLAGAGKGIRQEKEHDYAANYLGDHTRRGSSISTVTQGRDFEMPDDSPTNSDEDTNSSRPTSNYGLRGEKQLEQNNRKASSQTYDKQMLDRIGGPNTPSRQSLSYQGGCLLENGQLGPADVERRNNSLRPLCVPDSRHGSIDSPLGARWPSSGAVSPGNTSFWQDNSRPPTTRTNSLAFDDNGSHRGSYDQSMFAHDELYMDDGQMSTLNIHERSPGSPKAGSKRRASSPPRERDNRSSVSSISTQSEIYHRRSLQQLPTRDSPISRFHPNHSSLSSASSFSARNGSLGSSLGVTSVPSSATSYGSDRLSPSALSPVVDPEARIGGSYAITKSSNPTPALSQHQRTVSDNAPSASRKLSTESIPHSRNGSLSHMQGVHICECCPKKPRKFDTDEDLRNHEAEKQYTCAYCPNRFKNKNEAERHKNSLHVRRHSWSCAALSGIEAAYHPSPSASSADICGYCGEEFPNPPQWDIRAEHLNHVHKFGECNQAKKFFRADHFRQHLKHSHQGSSGKWTNMLENACMIDEPPEQRVSPVAVTIPGTQAPPTLMVTTTGLSGSGPGPGTIEETPHDS